jgi:hypothetical protein
MLRHLILTLMLLFPALAAAQDHTISPEMLNQIQQQFQGQVVGITDNSDGATSDIQVLSPQGEVIVVTVDTRQNTIINVRR